MKVTNHKTNEVYHLSKQDADKLAKSPLAKLFMFEKPAPTPPEIKLPVLVHGENRGEAEV